MPLGGEAAGSGFEDRAAFAHAGGESDPVAELGFGDGMAEGAKASAIPACIGVSG